MSLPPKGYRYLCSSCGHEFLKHIKIFDIAPCTTTCTQCDRKAAELVFDTIKEKHEAQRVSVRRAGNCISEASKEINACISVEQGAFGQKVRIDKTSLDMALNKLARAGQSLENLPK